MMTHFFDLSIGENPTSNTLHVRMAQRPELAGPRRNFPHHCFTGANGMSEKNSTPLTAELVRGFFDYDPETGFLIRRFSMPKAPAGTHSTCKDRHGYLVVTINRRNYRQHRVAWLHYYGDHPNDCIDHINGIRDDNRICNLRDVNRSQNKQNQKVAKTNKIGLKGVRLNNQLKHKKSYIAEIAVNGEQFYLGAYPTPELAHEAYCKAAAIYHTHSPFAT